MALLSLLAMAFTFAWTNESRADSILLTKHNLSTSGPGEPGITKATDQDQICVFCHVPHHAAHSVYLWSRQDPDPTNSKYTPYGSEGMEIAPGQPQGGSRLCLSCHDGSIANPMGKLAGGRQISTLGSLPVGRRSNLGIDLSDDHPISFPYTAASAQADGELALPGEIPSVLKLENGVNLECRTCHDPHKNTNGSFLVMSNASSALCTSCHRKNGWDNATHAVAPALAAAPCESCHTSHRAGGPWLNKKMEEETCFNCHSGAGGAADIQNLILNGVSRHNVSDATKVGVHDPTEDPVTASPHVECTDCHSPHAANDDAPQGPGKVSGRNRKVKGIDANGNPIDPAVFEYEICFRCHGRDDAFVEVAIPRQVQEKNERLRFDTLNPSFHPVIAARNDATIPGLVEGYDLSSVISCTDCHNSDEGSRAGGIGPDGPHGSNFDPILIARYETGDNLTPYVQDNFALCFRCHDPLDLFNATVSGFGDQHTNHVQGEGISCAVCHDPHGVPWQGVVDPANHKRLINFDTDVVTEPTAKFTRGAVGGTCTNTCHAGTRSY